MMLNIEKIKEIATQELIDALPKKDEGVIFTVVAGETLSGEPTENDPYTSIEYDILFEYGNCKCKHPIIIGWNEEDGVGIEFGEDGGVLTISKSSVMSSLYYDLALKDLDDKYLF